MNAYRILDIVLRPGNRPDSRQPVQPSSQDNTTVTQMQESMDRTPVAPRASSVAALSSSGPSSNVRRNPDLFECQVLFCKDGDTFEGMFAGNRMTFRLAGINTPEKGRPWAKEAYLFLKKTINQKTVFFESLGKDVYQREIVEVYLDNQQIYHVNKMLLRQGLATNEDYHNSHGVKTHTMFQRLANYSLKLGARLSGKGMWSKETPLPPDPVTPRSRKP